VSGATQAADDGSAALLPIVAVMQNAPRAMVLTDARAAVLAWNQPAQAALPGLGRKAVLDVFRPAIQRTSRTGAPVSISHSAALELSCWRVSDDMVMLLGTQDPQMTARLAHLEAEQKRLEAEASQLRQLAQSDHLTGLLNAAAFAAQCNTKVAAQRKGVLLYLDLDHFKPVNDTHGHRAGDHVLCVVADRLRATVRAGDLVARLGGDEFGIWLTDYALASLDQLITRIRTEMSRPIAWQDAAQDGGGVTHMLQVRASIGVAVSDGTATEFTGLMALADAAMYANKRSQRRAVAPRSRGLPEQA